MAKYLDFTGLQAYDELIKEFIDKNGGGIPQLTNSFILSTLSGNYLVAETYKDITFTATGLTTTTVSSLFSGLGAKAYPIFVSASGDNIVFTPLGITATNNDIENGELTIPIVNYSIVSGNYVKTEFIGKIPSSTLLETLKASQPNVIERIKTVTNTSEEELTPTDKLITIDLKPFLSSLKFGDTTLTVANNSLTISASKLKEEIEKAISVATSTAQGFMSAQDKQNLDTLYSLLGAEADTDKIVNTINEILAIFNQYPEGTNLLSALNGKVDKVEGKGLSTNDFTDAYKTKVENSVSSTDLNTLLAGYVPKTRKVNGKELSQDISVSQYRGNFSSDNQYYVGDLVSYNNKIYTCTTAHTATSGFAVDLWKLLSYTSVPTSSTTTSTDYYGLFTYGEKLKLSNLPDKETLDRNYASKDDLDDKVDKVSGKQLSTNDFTDDYKSQLDNLGDVGEDNIIEEIQIGGEKITPQDKVVNITVSKLKEKIGDATASNKGLMTTAQVTKLTNISANATADSAILISEIETLF